MAYFSNGSEGMDYMETYCFRCRNWRDEQGIGTEGCYVMDLHSLWNYEACRGKESPKDSAKYAKFEALDHFIRRSKNGLSNEQCRMFLPKNCEDEVVDKTDALKEWEAIYGRRES